MSARWTTQRGHGRQGFTNVSMARFITGTSVSASGDPLATWRRLGCRCADGQHARVFLRHLNIAVRPRGSLLRAGRIEECLGMAERLSLLATMCRLIELLSMVGKYRARAPCSNRGAW